MMPELYLADALGAVGKPMLRVHTAGTVGGSTAIVAASLIQAGIHERVLTVAFEKQSESNAMWALSVADAVPARRSSPAPAATSRRSSAPTCARSGAPEDIGIRVAVKDRAERAEEPVRAPPRSRHHLRRDRATRRCCGTRSATSRRARRPTAPARWCWPSERAMRRRRSSRRPGCTPRRCAASRRMFAGPRPGEPAARATTCATDVYAQAGITDPRREIDCAEIYVPFSWFEPMWLENLGFADAGEGWKMTYEGATALDGDLPVNCSGGVLSSQPDRRLRHAALRRGRDAGARPGRRAPGRRRARSRSATPTAAARSSSRCGSSAVRGPDASPEAGRHALSSNARRDSSVRRMRSRRPPSAAMRDLADLGRGRRAPSGRARCAAQLRTRSAREPVRARARGARRARGRRGRALSPERPRVRRGDDRLLQAARGAGQRELPLRRRRAALPARRRGRGRACFITARSRRASQPCAPRCRSCASRSSVDDGSGVDLSGAGSEDYESALAGASRERDFPERSPDDLFILYTGGTTGMPKGVMWRQEDLFFSGLLGANPGRRAARAARGGGRARRRRNAQRRDDRRAADPRRRAARHLDRAAPGLEGVSRAALRAARDLADAAGREGADALDRRRRDGASARRSARRSAATTSPASS